MKLTVDAPFQDVAWGMVVNTLARKFRIPSPQALKEVERFCRNLAEPLSLRWWLSKRLSAQEESIARTLCELLGADTVRISSDVSLGMPLAGLRLRKEVTLSPLLRTANGSPAAGSSTPTICITTGKCSLRLTSSCSFALAWLSTLLIGALFYALVAGLLLYGFSVLLVFVEQPLSTGIAAARVPSIGLGLICILVALSAIAGRFVSLTWRSVRKGRQAHSRDPVISNTSDSNVERAKDAPQTKPH